MTERSNTENSTESAKRALRQGYQAIPIRAGNKSPHVSAWTHIRWNDEQEVTDAFDRWRAEGAPGVGLLLGEPSGGLVDIDLDHPKALRMRDYFLPPTAMRSGRPGRPGSHYWYRVEDALPPTRRYKMPDGSVSVELRSTGSQTVVPPSIHPSGEQYRWEGGDWAEPTVVHGQVLATQVALLGLGAVLIDNWPKRGGRHDAYLALAGGLLRHGEGVHPWWEKNLPPVLRAMAMATNDEDGPNARVNEVMGTTLARLRAGSPAIGFPRLAEIIGNDHAEQVRRMAREVESRAGVPRIEPTLSRSERLTAAELEEAPIDTTLPPEERDPLGERIGTWQPVDLDPYLFGEIHQPEPTVLKRSDGKGLFYEGRVNSLYGQSEAAKSWIALIACTQEIALGERVMYLDLEDEPTFTLKRLQLLGTGNDDIRTYFTYVRPEDPHSEMQRNRFGQSAETDAGRLNSELFAAALERIDPSLIIVDGMTVLYGLHGLDSNDASSTDIITSWLKRLCRNGRSTVIVIDHTGKGGGRGASPIGAHHKIAMVQGTALQAYPVKQPMQGVRGEVQLLVFKDRPGAVRAISGDSRPQVAAEVVLDSTVEGITHAEVNPPDPDQVVLGDAESMERAAKKASKKLAEAEHRRTEEKLREQARDTARSDVLARYGGDVDLRLSMNELISSSGADEVTVREVIAVMLSEKILRKHSDKRWARYSLRPE